MQIELESEELEARCRDKVELDECLAQVVTNKSLHGLPHTIKQLHQMCRYAQI